MAEAPIEAEVDNDIPLPEGLAPPEAAPEPVVEQAAPPPQTGGGPVVMHDRYYIDPGAPLPQLDSPSAKAYAVEDRRDLSRKLYALICTPGLPTRIDVMMSTRGEELEGLVPLAEWETVDWPLLGQRSMALIYERPKGGRIMDAIENGSHNLNEYEFPRRIMDPLVRGVKSISTLDCSHRAIRPSNVFFMDEALLEPLRGMLTDTLNERWGLEELTGWLEGQKQPSLKQVPVARSDFPFQFEGNNFYSPRTLSRYLSRHRKTAMKAITDDNLIGWLRKGVEDATQADSLVATLETAALHKDEPQGTDEFVIAKACIVLDTQAPIRYKGFTFMPDGYAEALAVEFLHRGEVKIPLEVLKLGLPQVWYSLQKTVFPSASFQQDEFSTLTGFLTLNDPGFGFERCLYEGNPTLPCQSEIIGKDYVYKIEDVLPAIDAASSRADPKTKPMDQHLAAFIAARFEEDIHPHLKALAAPVEETATIGMLSLLAFLQWKLRISALYGLSSWVGGLLGPAINTYHSRTTRHDIEREIPQLVRKGSLPELFDLIDNAEIRRSDAEGFEDAAQEYAEAEYEIREIEDTGSERQSKAETKGK